MLSTTGQFSKIYKGDFGSQVVSIKVPKVPDHIRKDKSASNTRN